ncbi:MAG: hypothetical protein JWQ90_3778 [Hydrocarboniphaga sp.]|uniref:amino acid permease n=1 Tax=Hydrocarboniphaga sp. TaxID=2033016 RepID=UPI002630BDAA|nr:amino acid permease [Hydrocarboniphaga sp.]MDB5971328.1 hypothetical protein [Hydrocarboniphaga sp.]
MNLALTPDAPPRPHPRTLGWYGTTALAMGGSNQSLFIMAAMFAGQGEISGQGSAAVPLLIAGLLLAWAAAPGWTELILMFPNRVGGISASCAEAFRPYSPVLANLTGVCYWWGWIPTCGLTAILSASAVHHWYLPGIPITVMAVGLVLLFTGVNLCGVKWVGRLAVPIATTSAAMAFLSGLAPILAGEVDWRQALHFELTVPFPGWFGELTSLMAGLYLVGFAAPAFEAAACHVGETIDPNRNVPRAMFASGMLATLYFVVLPVVWLGVLGPEPLGRDLALVLGPTFAPIFGNAGKAAAIWFMVFSMFSGTMQPLAGASRTLMQLSEDGLLPRFLALRSRTDSPWAATLLTAGMAILFLLIGDPIWLIAAANFTYLIGISLPSVAVWLLRKDSPAALRPYRAPNYAIQLGLIAAMVWAVSALLGFEQFGLPTVVVGVVFAYAGSALYAWRTISDRRLAGLPGLQFALQFKLTGAMLMVLVLDGAGYLLAVSNIPHQESALLTALADIFVAVAMLSITVALVLPGMVAHSAKELSNAARHLAAGTMAEFSRAMAALGRGDIDAAHVRFDVAPVRIHSRDEVGEMAASFNLLQGEIGNAAVGLGYAREGLRQARSQLTDANTSLELRVAELHEAEEKLSGILESIDNIVWSASADSRELLYVNPAIERTHGRPIKDFIKDPKLWFDSVHPDDRPRISQELAELIDRGATTLQYRITRPDGEVRWLEDRVHVVRSEHGQPLRLDGVATDITDRRIYEERLDFLANHDVLTGLPNRNLLNDRLSQALALAYRTGRQVAVLFLDLDQFKYVNDHYGHTAGDELLRSVTARLASELREGDTLARLGGDEFVVMLWDVLDPSAALATARKLLDALSRPMPIDGRKLQISASIGVSLYPQDGDSAELLLQHADAAMYRVKHLGRNGVQFYTREMSEQTAERVLLEAELRSALERRQFVVHYQPQVSLTDGRVIGFEALIRWPHPELGDISPTRFIPIAEDTGLIHAIGEWVLRSACAQLKRWHDAGHDQLTVAVNMSARQINQNDIPALVRAVLLETGLAADHLELELTESALLSSASGVIDKLRELKAMGLSLAIDDFGTGYSSLGYLKRYPIDIIKIDRSFTIDVNSNSEAASIAGAIIAMAKSLGMKTVTEGLETGEQLRFFRTLGCDAMQGHYFAPALPAQEIDRCLREGFKVELPL